MRLTDDVALRFVAQVEVLQPNECWPWIGCIGTGGYGRFGMHRTSWRAHRVAWELTNGPIPDGLCVLHHCDNPPCVNPAHLFLGTDADNVADMVAKGRQSAAPGERNGYAKLTADQVREIYARYHAGGILQRELADEYGINQTNVSSITRGKRWRHVTLDA